jgi:hypothetical protein
LVSIGLLPSIDPLVGKSSALPAGMDLPVGNSSAPLTGIDLIGRNPTDPSGRWQPTLWLTLCASQLCCCRDHDASYAFF